MIRAAALSYAIVFVLIVGLIASSVLYISSTQKVLEVNYSSEESVIFNGYFAQQYGKQNLLAGDSITYIHSNLDTSFIKNIQWGAYNVVYSKTFKKYHLSEKASLVGTKTSDNLPCIYLAGNSGGLKITGTTRIEGIAFLPNKKIERAYIGGKNYKYDSLVFGQTKLAENKLPELLNSVKNLTKESLTKNLNPKEYQATDSIYSFAKTTTYYSSLAPIQITNSIVGNVIIHSFDSIFISSKAHMEDVIIIAPVVRFESGFIGNVQVVSHEKIILENSVNLLYPSSLNLNELLERNTEQTRRIILNENAIVCGGILITSQNKDFRRPPTLIMKSNSTVAGLAYVNGETDLRGSIIGHLYTESIRLNLGGSIYVNHLMDAMISSKRLPESFYFPKWLEENVPRKMRVIKWL